MSEPPKETVSEELPPFSFTKKPIRNTLPASAIPHNIQRTFSPVTKPTDSPSLNNVNYDDQIRAPRMSSATHYTYKPEPPRPFTDKKNSSDTISRGNMFLSETGEPYDPSKEDHLGNSLRAGPEGLITETNENADYQPATADLHQPTRRNSEPAKKKWGISVSVGNILSLETSENAEGVCNAQERSCASESSLPMQQKLLRAMDNLNANTTSQERSGVTERTSATVTQGGRIRSCQDDGPAIQQVYMQKKPMSFPAVLRPPQDIDRINEEDFLHDSSPEEVSFEAKLSEYPFKIPREEIEHTRVEPTHEHWRPNHSSDHCMNCFEGFRGFLSPQKRGRHHCRFCGLLYCHNCLHKTRETHSFEITPPASESRGSARANSRSSNTSSVNSNISTASSVIIDETIDGVMLDSKARIVIPMFKNMMEQGLNMASLHERFKSCKVCKTCGSNSSRLLYMLNQRSRVKNDISTPYVFIENPYINSNFTMQPHPLYEVKPTSSRPGFKSQNGIERRSSYTNVPSDWTWSSF
ncbi:hypothetical protein OXX80_002664 [Metschnikowia pulcherrima]